MILDDSDDDDADFWNEQNSRFWNVKNVKTFMNKTAWEQIDTGSRIRPMALLSLFDLVSLVEEIGLQ